MLSLKSLSVACTLGSTVLLGCTTHSADLPGPTKAKGTAASLQSHHWQLQQTLTAQRTPDTQWQAPPSTSQPSRTISILFSTQRFSMGRLCNTITGSYDVQGERITFNRLATTMMTCNDKALMQLEQRLAQQLRQVQSWKIVDGATPSLKLTFEDGAMWRLKGSPTHETLYGSSQQIFLEVAPEKSACGHTPAPTAPCMRIREIQYDSQGLKQNTGAWHNYFSTIEGYQHQTGVRNVLRIKRFTRHQTPAGMPQYIDVLDMAIESEIVR